MSFDKIEVAVLDGTSVTLADVFRTMQASGAIDAVYKGLSDTIAQARALELGLGMVNKGM